MSAREMIAAYRSKSLSPVEVVEAALARIKSRNPTLNALYLIDENGARDAAKASEARWSRGEPIGLLDGVPTTVKDALPLIGAASYRGSAAFDPAVITQTIDAPCVARLKESGAIILGKSTMCDYGIFPSGLSSKHEPARNPWSPAHTSGGSSSGAAVSVAAGINPVAVGTDIVGSIRNPASFCGLVGLKPSHGKVPYYFPNSPALVAGPIARDTADAALLHNVITRPDDRDFTALPYDNVDYLRALDSPPTPARLGLLASIGFGDRPDSVVTSLVETAARSLESSGFTLSGAQTTFQPGDGRHAEDFYRARIYTELVQHANHVQQRTPVIYRWAHGAAKMSASDLYTCYAGMLQLAEKAARLLDGFDYLLLPTVPVPAYSAELPGSSVDAFFDSWCNTFPFNLSENPAISINCGFTPSGLPVGLQIVGRPFDDVGVLRVAHFYERLRGPMNWPA